MKPIVGIFLLLLSTSIQAQIRRSWDKESDLVIIENLEGDSVTRIRNPSGESIESQEYTFNLYGGYPRIGCSYQPYFWSGHSNRYLGAFNDQFCILDSTMNVIIPLGDTVVPIWYIAKPCETPCKNSCHEGIIQMYYQVVNGDSTTVYDNNGKLFIRKKIIGFLDENYFRQVHTNQKYRNSQEYLITHYESNPEWLYGLINLEGTVLLPYKYYAISDYREVISESVFYLVNKSNNGKYSFLLYDASSNSTLLEADMIEQTLDYLVFPFQMGEKWGLYHPHFGILVKARFDSVESDQKGIYLVRNDKRKKWTTSRKVIRYFKKYKARNIN